MGKTICSNQKATAGTRKCIGKIIANCRRLNRPILVSQIRHGKLGMKQNLSFRGYSIQVDANMKPWALRVATFGGSTANIQLARTDIIVIVSSIIVCTQPLPSHPLLIDKKFVPHVIVSFTVSFSESSLDRSVDSDTRSDRHIRMTHAIRDQTNTPVASREMNAFVVEENMIYNDTAWSVGGSCCVVGVLVHPPRMIMVHGGCGGITYLAGFGFGFGRRAGRFPAKKKGRWSFPPPIYGGKDESFSLPPNHLCHVSRYMSRVIFSTISHLPSPILVGFPTKLVLPPAESHPQAATEQATGIK